MIVRLLRFTECLSVRTGLRPGRCRIVAGAPPEQTGPWIMWLRFSSPSSEKKWGRSEWLSVHPLQETNKQASTKKTEIQLTSRGLLFLTQRVGRSALEDKAIGSQEDGALGWKKRRSSHLTGRLVSAIWDEVHPHAVHHQLLTRQQSGPQQLGLHTHKEQQHKHTETINFRGNRTFTLLLFSTYSESVYTNFKLTNMNKWI